MMQSCASAARLLGGRPILFSGIEAMGVQRVTATSDHLGIHLARKRDQRQICVELPNKPFWSKSGCRRTQDGAGRDLADRQVAPQGDQQFACQRSTPDLC
jgi:hypothetical protein